MTNSEGSFGCASHFSQEYLVYFKEKAPLFGHVDSFQIDPSMKPMDFPTSANKKAIRRAVSNKTV